MCQLLSTTSSQQSTGSHLTELQEAKEEKGRERTEMAFVVENRLLFIHPKEKRGTFFSS